MTLVLAWMWAHKRAVGEMALGLVVLGLLFDRGCTRRKANVSTNTAVAEVAKSVSAVSGTKQNPAQILEIRSPGLAIAAKKITDAGGRLASHIGTDITIRDEAKAIPPTVQDPAVWRDEYHRFNLDIASGLFKRVQSFKYDAAIVETLDGQHKFVKSDLREYDPVTGAEIPLTGVTMEGSFEFGKEVQAPKYGFHLRGVAAADHRLAFGGGVQFFNLKDRFNLSGVVLYSVKEKEARAGVAAGWRLFKSNVSAGPYIALSSKGGFVYGGAITLELSR